MIYSSCSIKYGIIFNKMKSTKIEDLKIQLLEQLRTKGTTDYVQCEKLIAFARNVNDVDSLAIGHLWLAESFLHDEKKLECNQQLELARHLIDQNNPTEILEKYYLGLSRKVCK